VRIAIKSFISATCRHTKRKLGTVTLSTLSLRYIQSDRYKGQHTAEGETAASESESLVMTHTTLNVVMSMLYCLNHFSCSAILGNTTFDLLPRSALPCLCTSMTASH